MVSDGHILNQKATTLSTTTPLGIGGTFTPAFVDLRKFSAVTVTTHSDVGSAASGLVFEWSNDGTNVHVTESRTLSAGTGDVFSSHRKARYFRVAFTNGGTGQATFDLQTILGFRESAAGNSDTSLLALESGGNLAAAVAALEIIDDWDEANRAAVNLIAGQVGITAGAGVVAANTPRVTLASDDPAVAALEGTLTVAGTVTADAGTDLNTSLLALESGGNLAAAVTALQVIDDWDEANRAAVNLIASQVGITGGAGAVAANTPRVTLASNDPAVTALQIMDDWDESDRAKVNPIVGQAGVAAGAGTVGTTTQRVTLGSTDPAVVALQIIDDWDESDRAKINSIVGQAGVAANAGVASANTQRVVIATDQAVLPTGGAVAHDGVDSGNPLKLGMRAIAHGTNPTEVAAADRTDLYANRAGIPFVIGGHPNVVTIRANYTTAQTDTAIITVGAGVKIVVTQVTVAAHGDNTVSPSVLIGFGLTTTPTGVGVVGAHPGVPAGGGFVRGDGSGILGIGAANEDVRITSSVPTGGSIGVTISYYTITES